MSHIRTSTQDRIATIELDRPERLNALTLAMLARPSLPAC